MPHLHTQPHGHDVTISAWILRQFPSDGVRRRQRQMCIRDRSDIGLPGLGCKPVLTDSKPRVVTVSYTHLTLPTTPYV